MSSTSSTSASVDTDPRSRPSNTESVDTDARSSGSSTAYENEEIVDVPLEGDDIEDVPFEEQKTYMEEIDEYYQACRKYYNITGLMTAQQFLKIFPHDKEWVVPKGPPPAPENPAPKKEVKTNRRVLAPLPVPGRE